MEEKTNYNEQEELEFDEFRFYYDLIEDYFKMNFEEVLSYVPNTVLQKLGYMSGSTNYVIKFFSKKFHRKLYHNRGEMIKAIVKQWRRPDTKEYRKIRMLKEVYTHSTGIIQFILKTEGKLKIGGENFYPLKVAAEELGISSSTARSWISYEKLSATFMGSGYLIAESEINRLKNKG